MRTIVTTIAAILLTASAAQAEGCTTHHELYRIEPEYRAVMLDGGEIRRVMYVDDADARLTSWKPGDNITYCPDEGEGKMIDTTINSDVMLVSQFTTTCTVRLISDGVDRYLESAWKATSEPYGHPEMFVSAAKSALGWYYDICTDHKNGMAAFKAGDLKDFLVVAELLTNDDMTTDDPAYESTYKARAAKYKMWRNALYAAESKKGVVTRIWQGLVGK